MSARNWESVFAEQICALDFPRIPADSIAMAKNCVLDTMGVAIAGASEPAVKLAAGILEPGGSHEVWGMGRRAHPLDAAQLNGIASHALDFDDLAKPSMGGHPSAPLLPAVWAAAEMTNASGRDVLVAFVAGYEAEARLGLALGTQHYAQGFHSTATLGAFGAAAGAGRILQLDPQQMQMALSLAAAHASGLKRMFGTMGKPLQVGNAARVGLQAALLARAGYTAADDFLTGPGGFASAYGGELDETPLQDTFDTHWYVTDTLYKEHASCFGTHATIDALLDLERRLPDPAHIARIDIAIPPGHLSVCALPEARTGLEGKFSLAYTAALAVVRKQASPAEFSDERVSDPRVQDLAQRVSLIPDESTPELGSTVVVTDDQGKSIRANRDTIADGQARSPEEWWHRLVKKFHGLSDAVIGKEQGIELIASIERLDTRENLEVVSGLTRPSRRLVTTP